MNATVLLILVFLTNGTPLPTFFVVPAGIEPITPLTKQRDALNPIQQLQQLEREARQLEDEIAVIRELRLRFDSVY